MKNTFWFKHDQDAKDDPKCMLLIDELGLEGYGIFWILIETLRAAEPTYRCPLRMLGGLARKYNTTAQKMEVVVKSYGLFKIESDEFFFSESLLKRMLEYEQKKRAGKNSCKNRSRKKEEKARRTIKKVE